MKRRKLDFRKWLVKVDILLKPASGHSVEALLAYDVDSVVHLKALYDRGYFPEEMIDEMREDGVFE